MSESQTETENTRTIGWFNTNTDVELPLKESEDNDS